jgi:hypothetical protein
MCKCGKKNVTSAAISVVTNSGGTPLFTMSGTSQNVTVTSGALGTVTLVSGLDPCECEESGEGD